MYEVLRLDNSEDHRIIFSSIYVCNRMYIYIYTINHNRRHLFCQRTFAAACQTPATIVLVVVVVVEVVVVVIVVVVVVSGSGKW